MDMDNMKSIIADGFERERKAKHMMAILNAETNKKHAERKKRSKFIKKQKRLSK